MNLFVKATRTDHTTGDGNAVLPLPGFRNRIGGNTRCKVTYQQSGLV